jgi:hypothetical protein
VSSKFAFLGNIAAPPAVSINFLSRILWKNFPQIYRQSDFARTAAPMNHEESCFRPNKKDR